MPKPIIGRDQVDLGGGLAATLGDVAPGLAAQGTTDARLADPQAAGQVGTADALTVLLPQIADHLIREYSLEVSRTWARLTTQAPPAPRILRIVDGGAGAQVPGVAAGREVAGVEDIEALGDGAVAQLPGGAVCWHTEWVTLPTAEVEDAVGTGEAARPGPAGIGTAAAVNPPPEVGGAAQQLGRLWLHWYAFRTGVTPRGACNTAGAIACSVYPLPGENDHG